LSSSGTYTFGIANGSIVLAAFERIQIRAPSVRQEHLLTAQREFNLALAMLSNKQPNLWKTTLISQALTASDGTYDVAAKVVMILDAYISLNYGDDDQVDRYITPMSRTDYAGMSKKQTEGQPTTYWFDRTITPTITLWPIPDDAQDYTLNYYACTQMEDVNLAGGETPDVPYRWFDVLVAELSYRMARIYAPQLEAPRKIDAKEAWDIAATQDTEWVNTSFSPSLRGYYR
jgi:hypothetical protein